MLICEESIHCGCIPVILSDEYEVAFQHVIVAWRPAGAEPCLLLACSCCLVRFIADAIAIDFALLIAVLISTV